MTFKLLYLCSSFFQLPHLLLLPFAYFFFLQNLHLLTHDTVVLVCEDLFDCCHVDVGFLIGFFEEFGEIPGFDLSVHFPILFLYVPEFGSNRVVFFFEEVNGHFEFVVALPDDVLGKFSFVRR